MVDICMSAIFVDKIKHTGGKSMFIFNHVSAENLMKIKEKLIEMGFENVNYKYGDRDFVVGVHKDLAGVFDEEVRIFYSGRFGFRLKVDKRVDYEGREDELGLMERKYAELVEFMENELGIVRNDVSKKRSTYWYLDNDEYLGAEEAYDELVDWLEGFSTEEIEQFDGNESAEFQDKLERARKMLMDMRRLQKIYYNEALKALRIADRESGVIISDEEFEHFMEDCDMKIRLYRNDLGSKWY